MTLAESFSAVYQGLLAHRSELVVAALALPVVGTVAARIGKAGRTDRDGRFIASAVMGVALSALVLELMIIAVALTGFGRSILEADLLLLLAPIVSVGLCFFGLRWVFPLNELSSVRTFVDIGVFVAAALAAVWLLSRFRGWGITFFGSIGEMVAIGGFGIALLRRLYKRAFSAGTARTN